MIPTFQTSDLLLVSKRVYQRVNPKRGDIVIARHRNDIIVKRIVGLSGEEVEIVDGRLFINRVPVAEDYAIEPGPLDVGKGIISAGKFALFGDNRALPSRLVVPAVVAKDQIIGKVIFSLRWRLSRASRDLDGS